MSRSPTFCIIRKYGTTRTVRGTMRVTSTRKRTASEPRNRKRTNPYPARIPRTRLPIVVPTATTRLFVRYWANGMFVSTCR